MRSGFYYTHRQKRHRHDYKGGEKEMIKRSGTQRKEQSREEEQKNVNYNNFPSFLSFSFSS